MRRHRSTFQSIAVIVSFVSFSPYHRFCRIVVRVFLSRIVGTLVPHSQSCQFFKNLPCILEARIPQRWTNILVESRRVLRTGTLLQLYRNTRVQGDRRAHIRQPVLFGKIDDISKLVSTLQLLPILTVSDGKEKRPTIGEASTPCIPVRIRKSTRNSLIFLQFSQYSVDRLSLRRNNPDLDRPLLHRKHLRPQHRSIRNPEQLPRILLHIIPSYNEEPWAIRGPVNMRRLYQSVDLFLLLRQHLKISLSCRCQSFYQIFQWVLVDAAEKVEQ